MVVKDCFLGIDGGGTKTAAVLLDGDGREIARAVSGPSNYQSVGQKVAERSLAEVIHNLLAGAGLAVSKVKAIGAGMAGADRPADREIVRQILARIAPFSRILITNDAEAALAGGVGRRHGLALIAGTGAIAYGVNARGEAKRAGGWGYLLGDEGGAYWIGMAGLRAVVRAQDGRGPRTILADSLLSYLDLPHTDHLVSLIYGGGFSVPQLAALAPLVSQAAQDGDAMAGIILQKAGELLGETICAVIRGLNMSDEVFETVLIGGVLCAGGMVRESVVSALGKAAPYARAIEPRRDPAVGAALLAR